MDPHRVEMIGWCVKQLGEAVEGLPLFILFNKLDVAFSSPGPAAKSEVWEALVVKDLVLVSQDGGHKLLRESTIGEMAIDSILTSSHGGRVVRLAVPPSLVSAPPAPEVPRESIEVGEPASITASKRKASAGPVQEPAAKRKSRTPKAKAGGTVPKRKPVGGPRGRAKESARTPSVQPESSISVGLNTGELSSDHLTFTPGNNSSLPEIQPSQQADKEEANEDRETANVASPQPILKALAKGTLQSQQEQQTEADENSMIVATLHHPQEVSPAANGPHEVDNMVETTEDDSTLPQGQISTVSEISVNDTGRASRVRRSVTPDIPEAEFTSQADLDRQAGLPGAYVNPSGLPPRPRVSKKGRPPRACIVVFKSFKLEDPKWLEDSRGTWIEVAAARLASSQIEDDIDAQSPLKKGRPRKRLEGDENAVSTRNKKTKDSNTIAQDLDQDPTTTAGSLLPVTSKSQESGSEVVDSKALSKFVPAVEATESSALASQNRESESSTVALPSGIETSIAAPAIQTASLIPIDSASHHVQVSTEPQTSDYVSQFQPAQAMASNKTTRQKTDTSPQSDLNSGTQTPSSLGETRTPSDQFSQYRSRISTISSMQADVTQPPSQPHPQTSSLQNQYSSALYNSPMIGQRASPSSNRVAHPFDPSQQITVRTPVDNSEASKEYVSPFGPAPSPTQVPLSGYHSPYATSNYTSQFGPPSLPKPQYGSSAAPIHHGNEWSSPTMSPSPKVSQPKRKRATKKKANTPSNDKMSAPPPAYAQSQPQAPSVDFHHRYTSMYTPQSQFPTHPPATAPRPQVSGLPRPLPLPQDQDPWVATISSQFGAISSAPLAKPSTTQPTQPRVPVIQASQSRVEYSIEPASTDSYVSLANTSTPQRDAPPSLGVTSNAVDHPLQKHTEHSATAKANLGMARVVDTETSGTISPVTQSEEAVDIMAENFDNIGTDLQEELDIDELDSAIVVDTGDDSGLHNNSHGRNSALPTIRAQSVASDGDSDPVIVSQPKRKYTRKAKKDDPGADEVQTLISPAEAIEVSDDVTRLACIYEDVAGNLLLPKDLVALKFFGIEENLSGVPMLTLSISSITRNPITSVPGSKRMELRVKSRNDDDDDLVDITHCFTFAPSNSEAASNMRTKIVTAIISHRFQAGTQYDESVKPPKHKKKFCCDTCDATFKNINGLQYHKTKSGTTCNPNWVPKPPKPPKVVIPKGPKVTKASEAGTSARISTPADIPESTNNPEHTKASVSAVTREPTKISRSGRALRTPKSLSYSILPQEGNNEDLMDLDQSDEDEEYVAEINTKPVDGRPHSSLRAKSTSNLDSGAPNSAAVAASNAELAARNNEIYGDESDDSFDEWAKQHTTTGVNRIPSKSHHRPAGKPKNPLRLYKALNNETDILKNLLAEIRGVREEPTGEKPAGEEPAGEEPAGEEPAGEEPAGEEPAGEEPIEGAPREEMPAKDASTSEPVPAVVQTADTVMTEPSSEESIVADSSTADFMMAEPSPKDLIMVNPSPTKDTTVEPSSEEPVAVDPSPADIVMAEPSSVEPATTESSAAELSAPDISTRESTTAELPGGSPQVSLENTLPSLVVDKSLSGQIARQLLADFPRDFMTDKLAREMMLAILRANNGVFPGDRSIWFAMFAIWLKMHPIPTWLPRSTVPSKAFDDLKKIDKIEVFAFGYKDKKKRWIRRNLLHLPGADLKTPAVVELKAHIQKHTPGYYAPPEFAPPPQVLGTLQTLASRALASKQLIDKESAELEDAEHESVEPETPVRPNYADDIDEDSDEFVEDGNADLESDAEAEMDEVLSKSDGDIVQRKSVSQKQKPGEKQIRGGKRTRNQKHNEAIAEGLRRKWNEIKAGADNPFTKKRQSRKLARLSQEERDTLARAAELRQQAWGQDSSAFMQNVETGAWSQKPPKPRAKHALAKLPEPVTYLQDTTSGAWSVRPFGHGVNPIHARPSKRQDGKADNDPYMKRLENSFRPILFPKNKRQFLPAPPSKVLRESISRQEEGDIYSRRTSLTTGDPVRVYRRNQTDTPEGDLRDEEDLFNIFDKAHKQRDFRTFAQQAKMTEVEILNFFEPKKLPPGEKLNPGLDSLPPSYGLDPTIFTGKEASLNYKQESNLSFRTPRGVEYMHDDANYANHASWTIDSLETAKDAKYNLRWDEQTAFTLETLPYNQLQDDELSLPTGYMPLRTSNEDDRPERRHFQKDSKWEHSRLMTVHALDFVGLYDDPYQAVGEFDIQMGGEARQTRKRRKLDNRTMSGVKEEKFLVAVVMVRTLTGGLDNLVDWVLLSPLFPDMSMDYMKRSYGALQKIKDPYIDGLAKQFQECFIEAYESGEVDVLDYENLPGYDWQKLLDWSMQKIRARPKHKALSLPNSKEEFANTYFATVLDRDEYGWREQFYTPNAAVYKRIESTAGEPHSVPIPMPQYEPLEEVSDLEVAKSWLRAIAITPERDYSISIAKSKVDELGTAMSNQAFDALVADKTIMHRNRGRATVGRAYEVTEPFFRPLNKYLKDMHFKQAVAYKEMLDRQFTCGVPCVRVDYLADEGSIMCMTSLQAHGRIKLKAIDVPREKFGLTTTGYETRQIPRERLRFEMDIYPTETYIYDAGNEVVNNALNTPPPRGSEKGEIPAWYGITDKLVGELWTKTLCSVGSVMCFRAGTDLRYLRKVYKSTMEEWELRLLMKWGSEVGFLEPLGEKGEAWRTGEWWWLIVGKNAVAAAEE